MSGPVFHGIAVMALHSHIRLIAAMALVIPLVYVNAALASPDYVPGEVLVKLADQSLDASTASVLSAVSRHIPSTKGVQRIKLVPDVDVKAAVRRLENMPGVEYVQPNYIKHVQALPNDPVFDMQWALRNTGQSVPDAGGGMVSGFAGVDVDAPDAWNVTTGSASVVVAVIDTGIDAGHPDLAPNLWTNPGEIAGDGIDNDGNGYIDDTSGWDMVDNDNDTQDLNGHGTHIAGIIAARGNDGSTVAGLNWRVSLMALRAVDVNGMTTTADVVAAINYAVNNGARVINASYGSATFDTAERDAINNAAAKGVLFVAPACNKGQDNDQTPCYPASYDLPNIIAVAATDQFDNLAGFSNRGALSVDLGAPGVDIVSTYPKFDTVWQDLFDTNAGWVFGGTPNSWAIASGVLDDSPGGNYAVNTDNWAISPPIDLSGRAGCRVHATFGSISLQNSVDTVTFEGSTDQSTWTALGKVPPGIEATTLDVLADATPFDGANPFYVRLRLRSDNTIEFAGVTVDSLKMECLGANQGSFAYLDGTSVAAPFVTGVAALLLAQDSALTVTQLRDRILSNVDPVSGLAGLVATGGRLNAAKALGAATGGAQLSGGGGSVSPGGLMLLALLYLLLWRSPGTGSSRHRKCWLDLHDRYADPVSISSHSVEERRCES